MEVGQFVVQENKTWARKILEENCFVFASFGDNKLQIGISPTISVYDQHANKRITAGVYFEIAAKYAEKVGGRIIQQANVIGCRPNPAIGSQLVLASYPRVPMTYDKICPGFQELLLKGDLWL